MIKYIEELDTRTGIGWWDENRSRINLVIRCFNEWQIKYRFDDFEKEVLIARINSCRAYGEDNNFSDWQFEILDDMEKCIGEYESRVNDNGQ